MLRRLRQSWDPSQPSILDHVRAHVPEGDQPGLLSGGDTLPDEEPTAGVRFAPGMLDGVNTRHFTEGEEDRAVDALLAAVRACAHDRRTGRARQRLYELAANGAAIEVADRLLDAIRTMGIPAEAVRPAARWLVTEGRDREAVKLGITLLGLCAQPDDQQALRVLARHEEFTLYAGTALAAQAAQPDREFYALAQNVEGWGRIELVERLAATDDHEIREWIFRHGFRNTIMYEYLAHTAANTGDLVGHLRDGPDPEALDAACDIVSALIGGFPGQDLDAYNDGPAAVILLLEVLIDRATKLSHFLVVDDIVGFLGQEEGWEERRERGWADEIRQRAEDLAERIQAQPLWIDLATRGLESEDRLEFHQAQRTARALGWDTFPAHWRRLQADPTSNSWWHVMQLADETRIADILVFAEQTLPLDQIATGPGTELGLGPGWKQHQALDFIVQDLDRFPGQGWQLVRTALRSPVTRNRVMAIRTLHAWGRTAWPDETILLLHQVLEQEPDEHVRERLQRLLRGEPPDEPG